MKNLVHTNKKLVIFGVSVTASIIIGFLLPLPIMKSFLQKLSFYFLFIIFLLWIVLLVRAYGQNVISIIHKNLVACFVAAVLTIFIFIISPPFFKILSDETNLIGTSLMMYKNRATTIPLEGFISDYLPFNLRTIDVKRPMLFPFLTALLHSVLGYSPNNGFVLNFLISIASLIFFYLSINKFLPNIFGIIGMLLLASAPIYVICATSSGFELINLFSLIVVFFIIVDMEKYGYENRKIDVLLFSLVLFAYCRYESIIVLPIVFTALLSRILRMDFLFKMSWIVTLLPLSLLPALWVRLIHWGNAELNMLEQSGIKTLHIINHPFKLKNIINHFDDNMFILSGLNVDYGFSAILFFLSGIGAYLLIRKTIVEKQSKSSRHLLYTAVAVFTSLFIIISSFGWGNFGILVDNRLSLIFLPFLCWSAVYGIYKIHGLFYKKNQINLNSIFVILAVFHLLYFWPVGANQQSLKQLKEPLEYGIISDFLKKEYPNRENTLIIAYYSNIYLVQGYSALRINNVQKIQELINKHTIYDRILVIQDFDKKSGTVRDDYRLEGSNFFLREVAFFSLNSEMGVRISELQRKEEQNNKVQ